MLALSGCRSRDGEARRRQKIVIIGAGTAGLSAAGELYAEGFEDVVLLEARDRIGGRVWTENVGANPVDLGASWIQGTRGNPITEIARKHDIETRRSDYGNSVEHGGAATPATRRAVAALRGLARERPDASLQSAFERYLATHTLSDAEQRYIAYWINTTIEHEYAADASDLSFKSIDGGSGYGGGDVVFPGGYRQIVDVLAAGRDIRLRNAVAEVDYAGDTIVVTTAAGATFEAARVIVTVPLGVLKKGGISFSPPLPTWKRQAIDRLKMGVLNKTVLLFDDVFWERSVEFIGRVGAEKGRWAETLNLHPYTGQPILMMFNAGAYGAEVEALSDGETVEHATAALAGMYGAVPKPTAARITRWRSDPWAQGSYSYVPVGSSFQQYAEIGAPVDGKLFFAGEATHADYPSTVHGAFLSGVRAAREIVAVIFK
ncbi:MAG: FAD-dependent oxidoreductase [Spirochaetaceae bacterium]|nr:FAD-dependent oxidoreductase [Spirochaetaceae bacterium]